MLDINAMPGHLIRRLQQIAVSVFAERTAAAGFEITPVQYAALATIAVRSGLDQATLAGLIAYDKVTIGGVIDRLEKRGLVSRTVSRRDRRARELGLTAAGARLLERVGPVVEQAQQDMLRGLTPREADTLLVLLRKTTEAGNELSRAPLKTG